MGRAGDDGLTPDAVVAAVAAALTPVADSTAVVLAVSGGADSVGMARLVLAARPDLRATVVHVRHGLRDDAADAELAVAHAQALGLPAVVVNVAVGEGAGPEDAARQARLTALRDAATAAGAGYVLTGHTADDQAETVLLNIARGAGLPGLAGIPPQRPLGDGVTLLHPLLNVRRAAVRAVAEASGLPLASDPSNADADQRRARARHELLPLLAALTGGGNDPVVALARLAQHARRDTDTLDAFAAAALEDAGLLRWGASVALPTVAVDTLRDALATRVIRLLLQQVRDAPHPAPAASVEAVRAMADGQLLPLAGGVLVSRGGGLLAAVPADQASLAERTGTTPVAIPELGLELRVGDRPQGAVLPPWAPPSAAAAVPVTPAARVRVRPRHEGERISTGVGTQSVADAMVDAGVPRVARDLVPVISDEHGVLWVPGVAVRAGAAGVSRLYLAPLTGQ